MELRAFLDQRFPRTHAATTPTIPRLAELLTVDRVVLGLQCSDMEDVLDVAGNRLADGAPRSALAQMSAALKERESEVSSAIGGGVAVPCTRLPDGNAHAALVTLATPLPHPTPDDEPLRLVIVLAGGAGSTHRRLLLARIAWLAAKGLGARLASLRSPAELLGALAAMESTL